MSNNKALAIACITLILVTAWFKQVQVEERFLDVVQAAAWIGLLVVAVRAFTKKKAPE